MIIKKGSKSWRFPDKQIKSWDTGGNIVYQNIHKEFLNKRPKKVDIFIPDNPDNFYKIGNTFWNKNNSVVKSKPVEKAPIREEETLTSSIQTSKKKIAIMVAVYRRHTLTDYVYRYYRNLIDELSGIVELTFVAGGSEGEKSKSMAEKYNFEYIEVDNRPLSYKHDKILKYCKTFEPDGVVLIGSDDLISKECFNYYLKNINSFGVFGYIDIYALSRNKLHHWRGYDNNRKDEPIGAGRFFTRSVLDKADWSLWREASNNGLDKMSKEFLNKIGVKLHACKMSPVNGYVTAIRSRTNISGGFYERNPISDSALDYFNINEVRKILAH